MLLILIYFAIGIIVSRYLDKKMKIASIIHSVLFVYIEIQLFIICDDKYIVNMMSNILGDYSYSIFKNALVTNTYNTEGISAFFVLQCAFAIQACVITVIGLLKIITKVINISKLVRITYLPVINKKYKYILIQIKSRFKLIFLKLCRLLN